MLRFVDCLASTRLIKAAPQRPLRAVILILTRHSMTVTTDEPLLATIPLPRRIKTKRRAQGVELPRAPAMPQGFPVTFQASRASYETSTSAAPEPPSAAIYLSGKESQFIYFRHKRCRAAAAIAISIAAPPPRRLLRAKVALIPGGFFV